MKFLLDTNVFISAEMAIEEEAEKLSAPATELLRLTHASKHHVYLHPDSELDLERDPDRARRKLRAFQQSKYPKLQGPPSRPVDWDERFGRVEDDSNDWVDEKLLATAYQNAVDHLVTEDRGIHRKAEELGIGNRVLLISEALAAVRALLPDVSKPRPGVDQVTAYELNDDDPIFSTFREDYPGFDDWLAACKREHRLCWVVRPGQRGGLDALALVKASEREGIIGDPNRLKICTFKVAQEARGYRYGELLLKDIFDFAFENEIEQLYLTVFPKYESLIGLLERFGFEISEERENGELELEKRLGPGTAEDEMSSLEVNIQCGPPAIRPRDDGLFIIPIQPRYQDELFPELSMQVSLMAPGRFPHANAIRKAYLSGSNTNKLQRGDAVFFYRSSDRKELNSVGVVEEILRSGNSNEIAQFVARRSVYTYEEIEDLTDEREVLAINFRHSYDLNEPIGLSQLREEGCLRAAPQSITQVREGGRDWLLNQIAPVLC